MMILRSTPPSPFGRKVKLAASVLGLSSDIKVEPADTNDTNDSDPSARTRAVRHWSWKTAARCSIRA
jgi:glutathione S-transferase